MNALVRSFFSDDFLLDFIFNFALSATFALLLVDLDCCGLLLVITDCLRGG